MIKQHRLALATGKTLLNKSPFPGAGRSYQYGDETVQPVDERGEIVLTGVSGNRQARRERGGLQFQRRGEPSIDESTQRGASTQECPRADEHEGNENGYRKPHRQRAAKRIHQAVAVSNRFLRQNPTPRTV